MWVDPIVIERSTVNVLNTKLSQPAYYYTNCGGHAFGVQGWYTPSKYIDNWHEYHTKGKNHWRNLERKYVRNILREFPELRLIKEAQIRNVEIDTEKYEIIAFRIKRISFFCDFHFMRCEANGDWTEKKGTWKTIYSHPYEDIFDVWEDYDGKLFFFIRERRS